MAIRFAGMPVLITLLRAAVAVVAGRRSACGGCGWSAIGGRRGYSVHQNGLHRDLLPGGRPRVDRGHAWASMSLPRPSLNLVARPGDSFARVMGMAVRRRNWHVEVLSTHPGRRRAWGGGPLSPATAPLARHGAPQRRAGQLP